ncbi:MAG: ADP-forming succinate--CoA ligase subunit beta [Chloroflexi bacterium]|nr:ADP-forming succinate--CoA ligase subunit beta [Chloroflexota bacterium]
MKIHEYQAKEILAKYGVPIPKGRVANTPEEAAEIATELGGKAIVKAQVHAGGRGKAGGIKIVSSAEEASQAAKELIGSTLVTFQTGPEGAPIGSVLVEELVDVVTELYIGMVIDGATEGVVAIASAAGGMDIEEVAETTPEKILRVAVDPVLGLQPFQGRRIAYSLGVDDSLVRPISGLMDSIYKVFEDNDCSLVEINPLGITSDGRVLAMDAKLTIDDDAMFRHRDFQALRDIDQEDPLEVEAREFDINYVKLEGDIGCIVNGAGLAMATMDVVHAAGAAPANFLDIGGGADEAKVAKSLSIVLSDAEVKTVLVNLFGGILRCDVAARGFLQAAEEKPDAMKPMIVRMLGTNSDEGREIMANSGLDVVLVDNLIQAADAIRAANSK